MPKLQGERKHLSDFVDVVNEPFETNSSTPLIDLSIIPSNSLVISELNDSDKMETNLRKLKTGDFLFGSIRPYLKKSIVSPIDGATTGTVIQFRPKTNKFNNFLVAILTSDSFFNFAINNSTGTKMPVVKAKDLMNYEIIYNEDFVKEFESNNDYYQLIIQLLKENIALSKYKKFLLSYLFK